MIKFFYNTGNFETLKECQLHAYIIKGDYDIAIRGIINKTEQYVYVRVNNLNNYEGLEFKRKEYQYNRNLKECLKYINRNYPCYKVFTSATIEELPERSRMELLSC